MHAVVVSGPAAEYAVAPVEEALKRLGHQVTLYPNLAALRAAKDPLASADLLYGSGLAVDAKLLDPAPRLRAVVSPWIGTESFDLAALSARTSCASWRFAWLEPPGNRTERSTFRSLRNNSLTRPA